MKKKPGILTELSKLERFLRATLAIDVGSRFTRVVYQNKIVWHQPSCVTFHTPSQTVLDIGQRAWQAIGKTPRSAEVIFPVQSGKVSHIPICIQYIQALLKSVLSEVNLPFVLQLQGKIGVSSSLSPVDVRTWTTVLHDAGFQGVQLIPKSQALQLRMPSLRPVAWWLDIGDQTAEMGIRMDSELLTSWSWSWGGQHFTQELQDLVRTQYQATLSMVTANNIKVQQRTLELRPGHQTTKSLKTTLRVSDAATHEPKVIYLERHHLEERFAALSYSLVQDIQARLSEVSPDVTRTVLESGLVLTGGASQLGGLKEYLATELRTDVQLTAQPELELVWGLAGVPQNAK